MPNDSRPEPTKIELSAPSIKISIPQNMAAVIAAAPDPEKALQDFAADLVKATVHGDAGQALVNSAFQAGDAHGVERMRQHMLQSTVLADMLRQSFQAGRDREHRELHLDPSAIDGLAKALAGAVAAQPAPVVNFHAPEAKPRRQLATELEDGRVLLEDIPDEAGR